MATSSQQIMRGDGLLPTLWLTTVAGAVVALAIGLAGVALAEWAPANADEPAEAWVVENDYSEPFITCRKHAGTMTCKELDLLTGQPR